MFATTARSPAESEETPGPKNSTKRSARSISRKRSVTVRAKSVLDVELHGIRAAEDVDANRVVRRDVDRQDWIEPIWIAACLRERGTHRGDVDERRAAGRVMHQDAQRQEADFAFASAVLEP